MKLSTWIIAFLILVGCAVASNSIHSEGLYYVVLPNGLECVRHANYGGVTCNWERFNHSSIVPVPQ